MSDRNKIIIATIVENSIIIIVFLILAVVFQKWWMIFFSLFFYTTVKTETVEKTKEELQQFKSVEEFLDLYTKQKEKLDAIKEYVKQCDWHKNDVYIGEDILDIIEGDMDE